MKRLGMILTAAMIVMGIGCTARPATVRAEMKAGAARVEITPDKPCYLGGYYGVTQRSKGVHDPLHARVLVLDNGSARLVIIQQDLILAGGVMIRELKDMIQKEFAIPPENVVVNVAHTHTGPEGYYEEFGRYPKEYSPEMKQAIQRKTLDGVRQAVANLQPVTLGFESFQLDGFNSNRHDGDGPVDRTAILLVAKDKSGKPVAGFLNFGSHPTVVPTDELLISAEWTGMFMNRMEEKMGPGAVFQYLQGAAGNLGTAARGEAMVNGKEVKLDGWGSAQDKADRLADVIFPKLASVPADKDSTLKAAVKNLTFKVRNRKNATDFATSVPSRVKEIKASSVSQEIKERRIGWLNGRMSVETFMATMIPTMKRVHNGQTDTLVQSMRIGNLLMVMFPGEAITELSIAMRKQFGPRTVAVLGYSNDHLGYITTKEIYYEGGYEAGMGLVYPEATEEMFSSLTELGNRLMSE